MSSDPFEHHDGAYVLGVLDDADRRAFEVHLETCADCRARVEEVRPTAALLAGLPESAFDTPEPMPDTLLPGLLRKAARERGRRRWFIAAAGTVAAACVLALAIVLWPGGGSSAPPARPLAALMASPVSAEAAIVDRAWGTEIDLKCRYSAAVEIKEPYKLVIVDRGGHNHDAGTWTLVPGKTQLSFTGGTSVPRSQIHYVQVTTVQGLPILQLTL